MQSMTAFARRHSEGPWGRLTLELRSVNHRYLEPTLRMPEELRALEGHMRERLGKRLARGKVECNLRYAAPLGGQVELRFDRELAARLAHVSRELDALIYNPAPVSSLDLLRWPGVLQGAEVDGEALAGAVRELLEGALDELTETRSREGTVIRGLLEQRLEAMGPLVAQVRERLPQVRERFTQRLRERLAEVRDELEPGRLEQELVLFAQRIDVDEELDRLIGHIAEVRRVVASKGAVGRRLDFLMQELNREANTLGSKSADVETTRAAVELKVLIEQMREQVQNIE